MRNSRIVNDHVTLYMFGYWAVRCNQSQNFWHGLNREQPLWALFFDFAKEMEVAQKRFHFDRRQYPVRIGDHADTGNVANVNAFQANGGADTQTTSVVNVSTDHNFLREKTGCPGHDENENSQGDEGDKHGQSNSELGPFHLFFAWHVLPIALRHACRIAATAADCTPANFES